MRYIHPAERPDDLEDDGGVPRGGSSAAKRAHYEAEHQFDSEDDVGAPHSGSSAAKRARYGALHQLEQLEMDFLSGEDVSGDLTLSPSSDNFSWVFEDEPWSDTPTLSPPRSPRSSDVD